MHRRSIARGLSINLVMGAALFGCDNRRQEPPRQDGLQIEIEREPKEDGGRIKVKVNKPADDDETPTGDHRDKDR